MTARRPFRAWAVPSRLVIVWAVLFTARAALAALNVSTPRQTIETFLRSSAQGDFATAEQCLDLRDVPRANRTEQGILLSKELYYVLNRRSSLTPEALPDEPQPSGQGDQIVATEIPLPAGSLDIALSRVRLDGGSSAWLISRATVAATPSLYRTFGPPPFYFAIPEALRQYEWLDFGSVAMGRHRRRRRVGLPCSTPSFIASSSHCTHLHTPHQNALG